MKTKVFSSLLKCNSRRATTGLITFTLMIFAVGTTSFANGLEELQLKEGDEKQNEIKAAKAELLVRKTEDMALKQMQDLLKKHKNSPMEVELLFRLGELYMRRSKTERFFEVHRESETIAKLLPKKVKVASQKNEISKAITTYDEIRKRFGQFHKIDLVLFNAAFARQLINDDQGAEKLYWEIVSRHEESPLVPDAHLAIGEINYEKRLFAVALDHFLKIEKYPNSRAFSYGMYKAAWAHYNLQQAPLAMGKLEEVVKNGQYVADNGLDARLDLRKEALRDMALFYGDVYKPEQAINYFLKQSRDLDGAPYILNLVSIYKRHGKLKDVEVVLLDFIDKLSKNEKVADAYDELVWNYEKMLNREKATDMLTDYSKFCEKQKKNFQPTPAQAAAPCVSLISESSQKLAAKWHNLWSKNNKLPLFSKAAATAYEVYIAFAPNQTEEMAQTRYNYAEMLFNNLEYRKASDQYALVRQSKPAQQLLHDADYAAIVSLEKAVNDVWNDKDEKHFQVLTDLYIGSHPKGPYSLDLRFKRAVIAYKKNRYDEAAPQFKNIGWSYPKAEQGIKAQDLYLDILNLKKNFTELKLSAKSLLDLKPDGGRAAELKKVYQQSYFAEVQSLDEKGKSTPVQTAAAYLAFARENKDSELAPQAWWNATQIYAAQNKLIESADACAEMPKVFPKFEKNKECLVSAAHSYENLAQLDKAIGILLQLAEIEKNKSVTYKELAADFMAVSGKGSQSIAQYEAIIPTLGRESLIRVLWKAYQLAKKERMSVAQQYAARIIRDDLEPYSSQLISLQAEELFTSKKYSEAFKKASHVVGSKQALSEDKARARYIQGMVLKQEFEEQSVKARPDRLAMVLAMKTEKLEKAQKAFQSTINYQSAFYSLQSLKELGESYVSYAKALKNMPAFDGMSAEETQAFRQELENLIMPMEEKGIETFAQAVKVAKDLKLHDGTILALQKKLDQLNLKSTDRVELKTTMPQIYVPLNKLTLGGL